MVGSYREPQNGKQLLVANPGHNFYVCVYISYIWCEINGQRIIETGVSCSLPVDIQWTDDQKHDSQPVFNSIIFMMSK